MTDVVLMIIVAVLICLPALYDPVIQIKVWCEKLRRA